MFALLRFDSFFNVWYWALTVTAWTLVCQRTLGVPHDMILRARRLPDVAARVDLLARIAADRRTGLADAAGAPLAASACFGLASLGAVGFLSGVEPAKAAFVLLAPLALAVVGEFRLAREVRANGLTGATLRGKLARRRALNQGVAVLAILAAAIAALAHPPHRIGF